MECVRADAVGGYLKAVFEEGDAQLARTTFHSASPRYLRWPTQAKVIRMLETVSRAMVRKVNLVLEMAAQKSRAAGTDQEQRADLSSEGSSMGNRNRSDRTNAGSNYNNNARRSG